MDLERTITTALVLLFLFLLFYSKIKKQSILDSLKEMRDGFNELFETEEQMEAIKK